MRADVGVTPSMFMKNLILIVALLAVPLTAFLLFYNKPHSSNHLPIYYMEGVKKVFVNGKEKTDTVYHTVPSFKFIDQIGDTITEKNFQNKIYVANFFFTTCTSICPKMMSQMERVKDETKNMPDFRIISHSVNPSHDSVPVLAEYAKLINADPQKWMLVTGKKKDIYDIAIDGYKLGVSEDVRAPEGFLHSEIFVLVDKNKRIRGYYEGTDSSKVDKLLNDIKTLNAEYHITKSDSDLNQ